jgi:hypothetical protein
MMSKRLFQVLNILLLAAGVTFLLGAEVLLRHLPEKFEFFISEPAVALAHGLGDAFVIAAILALSVDSYLKRHLAKELAEEVIDRSSTYLMSFGLPRKIQDDVNHLCRLDFFYSNFQVEYTFESHSGLPNHLEMTTRVAFDVINMRDAPQPFTHYVSAWVNQLAGDECQPRILRAAAENLFGDRRTYTEPSEGGGPLAASVDEKGYLVWKKDVQIPPRIDSLAAPLPHFASVTKEAVPIPYADTFWSPHLRMDCEVRVHAPEWLFVDVTIGHRDPGGRVREDRAARPYKWRLDGCILPGGAISLEWRDTRGAQTHPAGEKT